MTAICVCQKRGILSFLREPVFHSNNDNREEMQDLRVCASTGVHMYFLGVSRRYLFALLLHCVLMGLLSLFI